MPQVGVTRELSVGDVSAIQHRRNVIIIGILAIVFIGSFFFSMRDLPSLYSIGIIFLLGFFLISFINIRIGFLLTIMAFLFSPEINLPMSQIRSFTVRTEDLLLIVLMLAWAGRLAMGLYPQLIISTPLNFPMGLIILWNGICSYVGILSGTAPAEISIFTNLKLIEFYLIFFVIANNLNNVRDVKFMFYALLFTALIIGIYACVQIPTTEMFTAHRLTAPFEGRPEPNTLGAYLAVFFGIALSTFLFAEPSFIRRLCLMLAMLLPLPIMFTFSRSAYLATIAVAFGLAFIRRSKWLIAALIFVLLLSPFILPKAVIDRSTYHMRDVRYYGVDQSAAERIGAYRKGWSCLKERPIFGGGVAAGGGYIDNQYMRVAVDTGFLGLILFFWLFARLFRLGIGLFKTADEGWIKGFAIGFVMVAVGMLIHGSGNVTFYIVRIAEPFWALAALIAYLNYSIENKRSVAEQHMLS